MLPLNYNKEFIMLLKDYVEKNRVVVAKMARALDITPCYLWTLIKGKNYPSIQLANKIEEFSGGEVEIMDLIPIGDFTKNKKRERILKVLKNLDPSDIIGILKEAWLFEKVNEYCHKNDEIVA